MPLIYLDHSATSIPDSDALAVYFEHLKTLPANPASLHRLGQAAAKSIRDQKKQLSTLIECHPDELFITSGGSESINWAIKGYLAANPKRGKTIITTAGEHPATSETLKSLQKQGYKGIEISLDRQGQPNLLELESALSDDVGLISMLWVNNETGAVLPVDKIVAIRNRIRPLAAIHLDGVQAFGKVPVNFVRLGVELLSGSGHKFGTQKGMGVMIKKKGVLIEPLIHGGGQQHGLRGGTETEASLAVITHCLSKAIKQIDQQAAHCTDLRQQLLTSLNHSGVETVVLSPESGVPHILNLAFPGLRGETLQHALEDSDIYLSTGSACSSHHKGPSQTLLAMGFPLKTAQCSIRVSLSISNTSEEIAATALAIKQAILKYQRSPGS